MKRINYDLYYNGRVVLTALESNLIKTMEWCNDVKFNHLPHNGFLTSACQSSGLFQQLKLGPISQTSSLLLS